MYRFAVITEEGRKLLADTTANNNLKITKILCGDGLPDGIEDCLTETKLKELMIKQKGLVSGQGRFRIESYSVSGDTWTIKALATKESASKAFKALEAGIYACRTNNSTEVMIAYFLAGDYLQGKLNDTADYIFIPTGGKATITLPIKLGSGINPEFVLAEDLHFSIEEGEDTNYLTPRKYRILTVKDEFGTYQTKIMDGMDGMPVGATYKQYPSVYKKVSITKNEFDANPGKYYQAGTGDAQNNDPFDVATAFVSGRQYFECIFKSYRPQQIYGGEWRDCTEAFAGYFERAEGGNSGAFGTNADGTPISQASQNKNHKHTTTKHTHSFTPSGTVSEHSHGLNNHTHSFTPSGTVSEHSHGLNNHTHSFTPSGMVSSHSHGLNNHTHSFTPSGTVSEHSHGLNNHTHAFTPSGTVAFNGMHYHYVNHCNKYPESSETSSRALVSSYHTDTTISVNYNTKDSYKSNLSNIYYPNISDNRTGIGAFFDTESDRTSIAVNTRLKGYQSPTSWSGHHDHSFVGEMGTTWPAFGNTTSATPTFTGKGGTTGAANGNTASATPTFTGKGGTTGAANGNTASATPTFTGKGGTTGAANGNTASATPTFTGKEGNTAGGGGLDTGNEGGDEARPVNIAYRMWQRVA